MMKDVTILTSDEVRRIELEIDSIIEAATLGIEGKTDKEDALEEARHYAKRIKGYLDE